PIEVLRPDIHDQQLILCFVEDPPRFREEGGALAAGQLAEKHAVLDVLPMIGQQLIEMSSPPVTGAVGKHVVGTQVETTVVSQRTTGHGISGISPRSHRASKRAWIRRMVRQEQR